jgi:hypothetical protein
VKKLQEISHLTVNQKVSINLQISSKLNGVSQSYYTTIEDFYRFSIGRNEYGNPAQRG